MQSTNLRRLGRSELPCLWRLHVSRYLYMNSRTKPQSSIVLLRLLNPEILRLVLYSMLLRELLLTPVSLLVLLLTARRK